MIPKQLILILVLSCVAMAMAKKKAPHVVIPKFLATNSVKTETKTEIAVSTTLTLGICAKLINVTGACRLQRGLWAEDPIVMTFDDELDFVDSYLQPSPLISVETTQIPHGSFLERRQGEVPPNSKVLQTSMDEDDTEDTFDEDFHDSERHLKKKRKFFRFYPMFTMLSTTTTTETVTVVVTLTPRTKTFFIQKCTPSPFPFPICQKSN